MIIEFPAPAKLLNLNDRAHWAQKARAVKVWRETAYFAAKQTRPVLGPSVVTVTLPCTTRHKRDAHNFVATVKPIIDGFVDAGVWPDDNTEWVTVNEPVLRVGGLVVVEVVPRG